MPVTEPGGSVVSVVVTISVSVASVVVDGRLITGRAAGSSVDFGLALVRILRGPDAAEKVAKGIVYPPAQ